MRQLILNAGQFHQRVFAPRREFFESLSHGQRPEACLITCSDSRIDPQLLTGCQPGELFVIRNAGNLIPPYGTPNNGEAASVEFAIGLGVRDLIVCGHSHCGAMEKLLATDAARPSGAVGQWLRHAKEAQRRLPHRGRTSSGGGFLGQLVEQNVLVQLERLQQIPAVAQRLKEGALRLHGWVYRIESGDVLDYDRLQQGFHPLHPAADPHAA